MKMPGTQTVAADDDNMGQEDVAAYNKMNKTGTSGIDGGTPAVGYGLKESSSDSDDSDESDDDTNANLAVPFDAASLSGCTVVVHSKFGTAVHL